MKGTIDEARIYTVFIIVFSLNREHCGTGGRAIDGNHGPYLLAGAPTFDLSISQFRENFNTQNPKLIPE